MKRRLHPGEVRMVAGILTDPAHDDDPGPEIMAERIVRALNEKRAPERVYAVMLWSNGKLHSVWGPYTTRKAAEADVLKGGVIGTKHPDCHATIRIMVTSDDEQEHDDDDH